MCWTRALVPGGILLLAQLLCLDAVPISIDKTKVKQPEKQPEEAPASVVSTHRMCRTVRVIAKTISWFLVKSQLLTCSWPLLEGLDKHVFQF